MKLLTFALKLWQMPFRTLSLVRLRNASRFVQTVPTPILRVASASKILMLVYHAVGETALN